MTSFGGSNSPTIPDLVKKYPDPTNLAQQLVKFCQDNYIDGLDYDLEGATSPIDDTTINWLVKLSLETRKAVDSASLSGFLISHAPQAPYFSDSWAGLKADPVLAVFVALVLYSIFHSGWKGLQ